jgi:hypothetical protein
MAKEKAEQRQELTPELREKRDAVAEVQSQLGELRKELSARQRNAGKPDRAPEKDLKESDALLALKTAWSEAFEKHKGEATPKMKGFKQWQDFEQEMGGLGAALDLDQLLIALADAPSEQEDANAEVPLRLELKPLSKEMDAGQKYLDTFPAAPLAERAMEQVDTLLSRLPAEAREFLRTIIIDFLANLGESFGMLDFSGSIRFQAAMEQAKGDKVSLEKLKPEEQKEVIQASVDPVVRSSLEGKWKALHKNWAQRKKTFESSAQGQKFAEFPPTIFDVYKKEEVKPTPTPSAAPTITAQSGTPQNTPSTVTGNPTTPSATQTNSQEAKNP